MKNLKTKILSFAINSVARSIIKLCIVIFDTLTRWIPFNTIDVLILSDFPEQTKELNQINGLDVIALNFNIKTIIKATFYARRCKVLYVDNMNIVVASLKNLDCTIIQVWHATSAVKQFGLPTVTDISEYNKRKDEFNNYDLVTANSKFMHEVFTNSFGYTDDKIVDIGCLQSKQLFEANNIDFEGEYILYVPTFRWDFKNNQQSIDFIQNFKSDKYTLIYSLHPKVEATISNSNTKRVDVTTIRDYFTNASLVISDYSSLLVDASLLCDKVVMYGYDYDHYNSTTGLNITNDDFWGYYTETEDDLNKYINSNNFVTHDLEYIKNQFFTYDDINSTERIKQLAIDIINKENSLLG